MRKLLIVGDFSSDSPSDVNSFLSQHFHTQLCTSSGKIVKSMLKLFGPDMVIMDIDGFDISHEEIFEAISEYNPQLPVLTYGKELKKQMFISYYYSGQFKNIEQASRELIIRGMFASAVYSMTVSPFISMLHKPPAVSDPSFLQLSSTSEFFLVVSSTPTQT